MVLLALSAGGTANTLHAQEENRPWQWRVARGETAVEVVMIFISGSNVPANDDAHFGQVIREAKNRLAQAAAQHEANFAAVGVALDDDINEAFQYLTEGTAAQYPWYPQQDFGLWDEVHVGRSWYNDVVVRHIFRSDRGDLDPGMPLAAIPQTLIIARTVTNGGSSYTFQDDRILRRLVGMREIRAWLSEEDLLKGLGTANR